MTLVDETGNSSIVVWNRVLHAFRAAVLQSRLIAVNGVVEREGEAIHVLGRRGAKPDPPSRRASGDMVAADQTAFRSRSFH